MKHLKDKLAANPRLLWIFALALLSLPGMAREIVAADRIRITIDSQAATDEEDILLGKIADIDGQDSQQVEKLKNISVSRAPLPGDTRVLEKSTVTLRLKQHGFDPEQLVLQVPDEFAVTRNYIDIDPEKIKALVSDFILNQCAKAALDAEIMEIQVTDGVRLPTGNISFNVLPPPNRDLVGKIPLAVQFDVDGQFYKRIWATATVQVLADVVVTRKPLGRHKPITEDDIELRRMDLAQLPSNAITDPDAVLGKRTRRSIGSQTVLRSNLVEFPPLVKRGDVVVIIAESNGLKITALGMVKKKGRLGENIPVVNYDSKKIIYAQVLDSSTVKVDF